MSRRREEREARGRGRWDDRKGEGDVLGDGSLEGITHDVTSVAHEIVRADVDDGVVLGEVLLVVEESGNLVVDDLLDTLGGGIASIQCNNGGGDAVLVEAVEGGEEGLS